MWVEQNLLQIQKQESKKKKKQESLCPDIRIREGNIDSGLKGVYYSCENKHIRRSLKVVGKQKQKFRSGNRIEKYSRTKLKNRRAWVKQPQV